MSTFDLIDQAIEAYCEAHSTPEDEVLYRLNRETHLEVLNPRMLSGQMQGLLLSMISRMMQPKRILEIGTFTGYSAIRLAEGLAPDGLLHTIEVNIELEERIRKYYRLTEHPEKIIQHFGDALQLVDTLTETWDLIFVDAEKRDYAIYYDKLIDKLRKGGFMLVDNTLWNGKIVLEDALHDKDTHAIMTFNDKIEQDSRVRNLLLPFRDGIMLIEKL